jgi:hypothetical protein
LAETCFKISFAYLVERVDKWDGMGCDEWGRPTSESLVWWKSSGSFGFPEKTGNIEESSQNTLGLSI